MIALAGFDLEAQLTNSAAPYIERAIKGTRKEFGEWQKEKVKEVFNKAISEFYGAYPDPKYERRGNTDSETGGLYALYSLSGEDPYGAVMDFADDFSNIYDEANMHSGRKGYSGLFQLVFVEGYHGGSRSIKGGKAKVWGEHPNPGVPYWRRRGFVRALGRFHKYGKWGSPAFSSTPPKTLVKEHMTKFMPEMSDEYRAIRKRHSNEQFGSFVEEKAKPLIREYIQSVIIRR